MLALQTSSRACIGAALGLLLALSLGSCSIKLVADYDSVTYEEIIKTGKKVDKFYGHLLEAPPGERGYRKFSDQYVDIETDIRSLYTRNQARALNEQLTEISAITLSTWIKYKDRHQTSNAYPDGIAKRDRDRFTRLFVAAASAEQAKKLDADDKDPDKESK